MGRFLNSGTVYSEPTQNMLNTDKPSKFKKKDKRQKSKIKNKNE
jgi:hypothetical protein